MSNKWKTYVQDIEWAYYRVLYWGLNAVWVVYTLAVFTGQNISAVYYRVRNAVRDTAGGTVIELKSDEDYAAGEHA
jgi:hypothetical protein